MAQYDYNTPTSQAHEQKPPRFTKGEDTKIPDFAREVPLRTIVKKHGNNVTVEHEWNMLGGEHIKISIGRFRGDPNMENVHKISVKDGEDVGSFRIANTTYIIRKTSEGVAKEVFRAGGKIRASILDAIGYFRTVKGNFYTVSKVEGETRSMDKRLGLKELSLEGMDSLERREFADLVMEEMIKLYRQGYALRNFSLADVIVTKKRIVFGNVTALLKVGAAKTVDNFLANLRVMVKGGVADKGDVVYGIALSFGAMKKEHSQWAKENNAAGQSEAELLERMEADVLG